MMASSAHLQTTEQAVIAGLLHSIVRRLDNIDARLDDIPTNGAMDAIAERMERRCEEAVFRAVDHTRELQSHECAANAQPPTRVHIPSTARARAGAAAVLMLVASLLHQRTRRRINRTLRRLPVRVLLLTQLLSLVLLSASSAADAVREGLAGVPVLGALLLGQDPVPLLSKRSRECALGFIGVATALLPWRLGLELG